jgi:hypothetical protein
VTVDANKRTLRITRHEWTLPSPAHHTEVGKAVIAAEHEQEALRKRGLHPTDIVISSEDELVVIGFEVAQPEIAQRGLVDVARRVRQESQREVAEQLGQEVQHDAP